MVAFPYHHGMPAAGKTQALKKPIFFTSALWIPFYNSFNCFLSHCSGPDSSLHRTKKPVLSETKTTSTRHVQNNLWTYLVLLQDYSFFYVLLQNQSWNSLGSYNFNEIIYDIMIFLMRILPPICFLLSLFLILFGVFFLFYPWGTGRNTWKHKIHPSLTF